MDEVYYNLSYFNLWGTPLHSRNDTVEATELWRHQGSGTVRSQDVTVHKPDLETWLDRSTVEDASGKETLIARFVWAGITLAESGNNISLSKSSESRLLDRFGIKLAHNYSRSCVTGVTALPPTSTPLFHSSPYSFSYAPKLAAIWSHTRYRPPQARESVTEGIIFAQQKQKETLKAYLANGRWQAEVSKLAMFPAFLISILLGNEIGSTQESIKNELRHIESRTGYHNFASRNQEAAATEELGDLSAKTNGHATKLASTERKRKTLEKLLDFMGKILLVENAADEDWRRKWRKDDGDAGLPTGYALLKNHVAVLKDRLEFQTMDADYTAKRIETQIAALLNIITQRDSGFSLDLTELSAEIALYSYRDSSSMKTLAVVTMFFLPGSFISALFSTPCFDWDRVDLTERNNIGVPSTPQFLLYWTITIPLTVATFILYFLWLWVQKRKQKQRLSPTSRARLERESANDSATDEPEKQQLVRGWTRRETMANYRNNS